MSEPSSRIDIVNVSGGILGMLFASPLKALQGHNNKMKAEGWIVHQVQPMGTTNIVAILLQLLLLILTLLMYTRSAGFVVVSHKYE